MRVALLLFVTVCLFEASVAVQTAAVANSSPGLKHKMKSPKPKTDLKNVRNNKIGKEKRLKQKSLKVRPKPIKPDSSSTAASKGSAFSERTRELKINDLQSDISTPKSRLENAESKRVEIAHQSVGIIPRQEPARIAPREENGLIFDNPLAAFASSHIIRETRPVQYKNPYGLPRPNAKDIAKIARDMNLLQKHLYSLPFIAEYLNVNLAFIEEVDQSLKNEFGEHYMNKKFYGYEELQKSRVQYLNVIGRLKLSENAREQEFATFLRDFGVKDDPETKEEDPRTQKAQLDKIISPEHDKALDVDELLESVQSQLDQSLQIGPTTDTAKQESVSEMNGDDLTPISLNRKENAEFEEFLRLLAE